ncbi:MAG: cytochrome c-type biogenesis protein CcmH [bacterium]
MRHKNPTFLTWLFLLISFSIASADQQQVTIGEIKNSLVCLCDCNMTVEACQGSMACDSAEKLTAEAQQYIDQGMEKQAVLATFIKKYGEHILAAPTKKGFNLTAWILPFAAIILAGYGIIKVVRRWVRQPQIQAVNVNPQVDDAEKSPYEEKLDEVLRYLD